MDGWTDGRGRTNESRTNGRTDADERTVYTIE